MESFIAGVAVHRNDTTRAFDSVTIFVKYTEAQRTTFMFDEPARDITGETADARLLEAREDGTWLLLARIVWADAFRGQWAIVAAPDASPVDPSCMLRLPDHAVDIDQEDVERAPLLQRARWLCVARRAWEARSVSRQLSDQQLAELTSAALQLSEVGWIQQQLGRTLASRRVVGRAGGLRTRAEARPRLEARHGQGTAGPGASRRGAGADRRARRNERSTPLDPRTGARRVGSGSGGRARAPAGDSDGA